ncbi:hypothetical protein OpiT1DRAFT_05797 [Opitutaceae bacterium TAV1]|nr:hypothetical protein OpiT1DRAFT_05797 [Opitutaceae bacterium TAV1]
MPVDTALPPFHPDHHYHIMSQSSLHRSMSGRGLPSGAARRLRQEQSPQRFPAPSPA